MNIAKNAKFATMEILGKRYSIFEESGNLQRDEFMGTSNLGEQRIVLSSKLGNDQKRDTLLHEVLHIIDKELFLGFDEATVGRIAVGLYSAGVSLKVWKDLGWEER